MRVDGFLSKGRVSLSEVVSKPPLEESKGRPEPQKVCDGGRANKGHLA